MRQRTPPRTAKAAVWIVALAVLVLVVAGPGYRLGLLPLGPALLAMPAVTLAAAVALVLGMIGLFRRRGTGTASGRTVVAVVIAAALTLNGGLWLARTLTAPPIHDISTDLENPPAFDALVAVRAAAGAVNPSDYVRESEGPGGPISVPDAQRAAYPEIGPLRLPLARNEALELAERAARDMGWEIVAVDGQAGRVEATDTTLYFGFKDDIVVRVRSDGDGSVLDVRSKSRIGLGDAGTNAQRIDVYLQKVMALASG